MVRKNIRSHGRSAARGDNRSATGTSRSSRRNTMGTKRRGKSTNPSFRDAGAQPFATVNIKAAGVSPLGTSAPRSVIHKLKSTNRQFWQ